VARREAAGIAAISAILREASDAQAFRSALVENIHRKALQDVLDEFERGASQSPPAAARARSIDGTRMPIDWDQRTVDLLSEDWCCVYPMSQHSAG
jgi:hypothetical protein